MGKRDPKVASGPNSNSSKGKHLHEAHKTTAATTAKVAAAQEGAKQTTPDTTNSSRAISKDASTSPHKSSNQKESRKKLLQKQTPVNSNMAPGISSTVAAIQRIAENSAPAPKVSNSPAAKVSRLKPSMKSASKSPPIKSPVISTSGLPIIERLRPHPETPSSEEHPPPLPARPSPQRSTSAEGSLLSIVKKGRGQIRSGGLGAAKFLGKKGHEAWGKIKKGKSGPSVPADSVNGTRDTSNDIDVFGMDLRDAVHKTRIIKQRRNPGEAAYWMPALAYRCLQYVYPCKAARPVFHVGAANTCSN